MLGIVFLELTGREILQDIPHDLGALIAYSLLAALVTFIIYGSRQAPSATENQADDAHRGGPQE